MNRNVGRVALFCRKCGPGLHLLPWMAHYGPLNRATDSRSLFLCSADGKIRCWLPRSHRILSRATHAAARQAQGTTWPPGQLQLGCDSRRRAALPRRHGRVLKAAYGIIYARGTVINRPRWRRAARESQRGAARQAGSTTAFYSDVARRTHRRSGPMR